MIGHLMGALITFSLVICAANWFFDWRIFARLLDWLRRKRRSG